MCINKITELNGFKGKRAGEDCFTWKLRETGVCVCLFLSMGSGKWFFGEKNSNCGGSLDCVIYFGRFNKLNRV